MPGSLSKAIDKVLELNESMGGMLSQVRAALLPLFVSMLTVLLELDGYYDANGGCCRTG